MNDEKRSGCFKYGCFGCLGVLAFCGLLLGLAIAFQVAAANQPVEMVTHDTAQVLPELPPEVQRVIELPAESELDGDTASDQLPVLTMTAAEAAAVPTGRVVLDLSMGEFDIRPAPAGESLRIEGSWDSRRFNLEETMETADDGSWTYTATFGGSGRFMGLLFGGGEVENRLTVWIPEDRRVDLIADLGLGEHVVNLGGLWLGEVELDMSAGEFEVEVADPTKFPIESFTAEQSMGELRIFSLGNASPGGVSVKQSMGALQLDLEGAWTTDSTVDVRCSMGECGVSVPDNVHIALDKASVAMGERNVRLPDDAGVDPDAPTVSLSVEASMGEVRVR